MEPEKGGPIERLWKIYDQAKLEPDEMKRRRLAYEIIKIHIDEGPVLPGHGRPTPRR